MQPLMCSWSVIVVSAFLLVILAIVGLAVKKARDGSAARRPMPASQRSEEVRHALQFVHKSDVGGSRCHVFRSGYGFLSLLLIVQVRSGYLFHETSSVSRST